MSPCLSVVRARSRVINGTMDNRLTVRRVIRVPLVEKMRDGMIVLDAEGNVVDINPAVQKALGISAAQAIGQRAKDLFGAWPHLVERYANTLEAQDEISFGEADSQTWYELRMSPLVDSRERLLGRVVTVRDITEKKTDGRGTAPK